MPTINTIKENAYREGMLQYYNTVLLEKGLISQSEYRTMQMKIRSAYTPSARIAETRGRITNKKT